jgi:hypothetical protein
MKLNLLTKLLVSVFLAFCAFGFVACSDDDEKEKTPDFSHLALVGTWETNIPQDGYTIRLTLTINSNGTCKEEQVAIMDGQTYPVQGSPMSANWTGTATTFRITSGESTMQKNIDIPYQVNGSTLKIGDDITVSSVTLTKK